MRAEPARRPRTTAMGGETRQRLIIVGALVVGAGLLLVAQLAAVVISVSAADSSRMPMPDVSWTAIALPLARFGAQNVQSSAASRPPVAGTALPAKLLEPMTAAPRHDLRRILAEMATAPFPKRSDIPWTCPCSVVVPHPGPR